MGAYRAQEVRTECDAKARGFESTYVLGRARLLDKQNAWITIPSSKVAKGPRTEDMFPTYSPISWSSPKACAFYPGKALGSGRV